MPKKLRLESLGIYLPEKVTTMEEMLRSCRRRPRWDLERITGIKERRVAVNEYAADLAIKAAERALGMSRYKACDLDAIICGVGSATSSSSSPRAIISSSSETELSG